MKGHTAGGGKPLWVQLIAFPFQVCLAFFVCVFSEGVFLVRDFIKLITGKKIS